MLLTEAVYIINKNDRLGHKINKALTLSSHDLGHMFGAGDGHALGHVDTSLSVTEDAALFPVEHGVGSGHVVPA
jgi:hypothetical protein